MPVFEKSSRMELSEYPVWMIAMNSPSSPVTDVTGSAAPAIAPKSVVPELLDIAVGETLIISWQELRVMIMASERARGSNFMS